MMEPTEPDNPILKAMLDTFIVKRTKRGDLPPNWILALLCLLDQLRESDKPLTEDDVYTYDYTLQTSRAQAITRLIERQGFPRLPLSKEGITMRGAPALRFFKAIKGGGVVFHLGPEERTALIDETIEVLRGEAFKVVNRKPVSLPRHVFEHSGRFVVALLAETADRSQGRVEQAIVGAKLQLRHPSIDIQINTGFAPDRQTGRESDYDVKMTRVIVSVAPKDNHFQSAKRLSDEGKQVIFIVSDRAAVSARERVRNDGCPPESVRVKTVEEYVTENMIELGTDLGITPRDMCMRLVAEYNRRIGAENDWSLQVVVPADDTSTAT